MMPAARTYHFLAICGVVVFSFVQSARAGTSYYAGGGSYSGSISGSLGLQLPGTPAPVTDTVGFSEPVWSPSDPPPSAPSPFFAASTDLEDALNWFGLDYVTSLELVAGAAATRSALNEAAQNGYPIVQGPVSSSDLHRSLAMLSYGADGETLEEIKKLLGDSPTTYASKIPRARDLGRLFQDPATLPPLPEPPPLVIPPIGFSVTFKPSYQPYPVNVDGTTRPGPGNYTLVMDSHGEGTVASAGWKFVLMSSAGTAQKPLLNAGNYTLQVGPFGELAISPARESVDFLTNPPVVDYLEGNEFDEAKSVEGKSRHLTGLLGLVNESSMRMGVLFQDSFIWYQRGYRFSPAFQKSMERAFGAVSLPAEYRSKKGRQLAEASMKSKTSAAGTGGWLSPVVPSDNRLRLLAATTTSIQAKWNSHLTWESKAVPASGWGDDWKSDENPMVRALISTGWVGEYRTDLVDAVLVPIEEGVSLLLVQGKGDEVRLLENPNAWLPFNSTAGAREDVYRQLTQTPFREILARMVPANRRVVVPQFTANFTLNSGASTESAYPWGHSQRVEKLVLPLSLDKVQANFSHVNRAGYLYLEGLTHRASVGVTPDGVTCMASTQFQLKAKKVEPRYLWHWSGGFSMTVIGGGSLSFSEDGEPATVRPFAYAVIAEETGTILFSGMAQKEQLLAP